MTLTEQRPDYDRQAPQGDSAAWHELLSVTLHIFHPMGSSEGVFDITPSPSGTTGMDLGKDREKQRWKLWYLVCCSNH